MNQNMNYPIVKREMNNYLFTYKLVYNADTGIISEFKHIYFKDGKIQNAPANNKCLEKYGLPGFYTKKLSYLSQDGSRSNRAKRYRIMVFDNNYKSCYGSFILEQHLLNGVQVKKF